MRLVSYRLSAPSIDWNDVIEMPAENEARGRQFRNADSDCRCRIRRTEAAGCHHLKRDRIGYLVGHLLVCCIKRT